MGALEGTYGKRLWVRRHRRNRPCTYPNCGQCVSWSCPGASSLRAMKPRAAARSCLWPPNGARRGIPQVATAEGTGGDASYPLSITRAATSSVDAKSGQRALDGGKTARVAMGTRRCWELRGAPTARSSTRERDSPSIAAVLLVDVGWKGVEESKLQRGFELLWMEHARWGQWVVMKGESWNTCRPNRAVCEVQLLGLCRMLACYSRLVRWSKPPVINCQSPVACAARDCLLFTDEGVFCGGRSCVCI